MKRNKAFAALIGILIVNVLIEAFFDAGTQFLAGQTEAIGSQLRYHDAMFLHYILLFPATIACIGLAIYMLLNRQKAGFSVAAMVIVIVFAFSSPFKSLSSAQRTGYQYSDQSHSETIDAQAIPRGRKGEHYKILQKEFRRGQEVIAVDGFELELANHLKVFPYGINKSLETKYEFQEYVAGYLLYVNVRLVLPRFDEFQKNYFLEKGYVPSKGKEFFKKKGETFKRPVPVLIYVREDEMLNSRFQ